VTSLGLFWTLIPGNSNGSVRPFKMVDYLMMFSRLTSSLQFFSTSTMICATV
jgi:hypothetical protein